MLTVLPPYPTTGRSYGMPNRLDLLPVTGRSDPPRNSIEQFSLTSTFLVAGPPPKDHGGGANCRDARAASRASIACRNMPYS